MPEMKQLLKGYQSFSQEYFSEGNELQGELAQGQTPKVLVIACCDSRVDPAIILQASPGDLFTVRNVANIVPPYCNDNQHHGVSSAMEFAVKYLEVRHILVMGHSLCGGIQGLLADNLGDDDFIGNWVSILNDAKALAESKGKSPEDKQHLCELEGIKLSLKNLLGYSWVAERMTAGKLSLHGWHYNFQNGELLFYETENNVFKPLT